MANRIYPKFKQALLGAGVNLVTGTVKAVLIDTGAYTYSDAHTFLSDVPAAARIGTPQTLLNKTVTNGVLDADDVTFPNVAAGTGTANAVEAYAIYRDSGTEGSSELIAYLDGEVSFEIAAASASGATTLTPEDMPVALLSGAVLTKVSGTGPTTVTLSAPASVGDRSLTIGALGSAVAAGAVYKASTAGLPLVLNGGSVKLAFDPAGILAL